MALSVNLLTTVAQCDAVLATIDDRLRLVNKREIDADYQRDGATSDATAIAARLTRLPGLIANLTADLAAETPGTPTHAKLDLELDEARLELKRLTVRQGERGPVYLVEREVLADEAETARTSLQANRALVVTRRAAL